MNRLSIRTVIHTMALLIISLMVVNSAPAAEPELKVLIVDGRNNHDWRSTTPHMKKLLEETGMFSVDVATAPIKGQQSLEDFKPEFSEYDAILMNYNGNKNWPKETRKAFEKYVSNGGGVVIVHAADNAFPNWEEYNEMIGLGGWGGRNEKSGPMVRYRDGEVVLDDSPGAGGTHGPQRPYLVEIRDNDHPITEGLPEKWMHSKDELYSKLRGPAKNLTVLATAKSKKTNEHEPALFTIDYGKGRIFHTVLGHSVEAGMKCVGFIATLQRGTEWAATGEVTQDVPADFPDAREISIRSD